MDLEHRDDEVVFSITKSESRRIAMGRGILLWLLGVPIPVIIILLLIFHH
jgi:hypothetical protein